MIRPKPLGKLLKVGDRFKVTTKRMSNSRWDRKNRVHGFDILQPGHIGEFVKGKRKYICEVLGVVELSTGYYVIEIGDTFSPWNQWYMFTYYVKILEN